MTEINLGKVLVTLEGEHDSTRSYDKYCEVSSDGSSYVSKDTVPIGTPITDTTFWQKRASKGIDGRDGTDGNDGLDAYQPFKGWFDTTSDLNTAFASPQVGDYAYVKGATASDPTTIYECTTAGTWALSQREFNPANNQSFASGEELNTTHIVDNLNSSSPTDVLSAKQGKALKTGQDDLRLKLDGELYNYSELPLTQKTYMTIDANESKIVSMSAGTQRIWYTQVSLGDKVRITGSNTTSVNFGYGFTTTTPAVDVAVSGAVKGGMAVVDVTLVAPSDGYVVISHSSNYYENVTISKLTSKIVDIESSINDLETSLPNKVDKVEGKKLIDEQYAQDDESSEFIEVHIDGNSRILYGVKVNGDFFFGKGIPSQIMPFITGSNGSSIDGLNKILEFLSGYTTSDTLAAVLAEIGGGQNFSIKSYFEDEMEATRQSINAVTDTPAVVFPILTDSHIAKSVRSKEQVAETIANVRNLCNTCHCDAIVHLGDLLMQSMNSESSDTLKSVMASYMGALAASHPQARLYAVGGNHDGLDASHYDAAVWYSVYGRKASSDITVAKSEETAPYYYVDYPKCNLRCVFLQQPNNYNASARTFGYTEDMLTWLSQIALNVEDGTHVVFFSHIPPLQANYVTDGVVGNRATFYGICNAFHNHTTYSDNIVSCDFSSLQSSKILCYICGHVHGDRTFYPGETYNGNRTSGDGYIPHVYENGMPCHVVVLPNTYVGESGNGTTPNSNNMGETKPRRADGTVTQEAWSVFVFNPLNKKIYFFRFGSGNDQEIDLSNII